MTCKIEIPGLDAYKCSHCGWVPTEWGIEFLKAGLSKSGKKSESKKDAELNKYIKDAIALRKKCKCTD